MALTTRLATAADHAVFARLFPALEIHDPLPDLAQFTARMLPRVVLVCEGSEPIGYGFWQVYGRTAHVVHVVVDAAARGRGAGRALMEALRARVTDEGCTRWYLNVKRDNHAARRLYERVGLGEELETWALELPWAAVGVLPAVGGARALVPTAADDAAIAARFALEPERLQQRRAQPGQLLVALREADDFVAFACFEPDFPRAYPFRLTRPALARALLEALRPHASARFAFVHLVVEGDAPLRQVLVAAGARVTFELSRLGAAIEAG